MPQRLSEGFPGFGCKAKTSEEICFVSARVVRFGQKIIDDLLLRNESCINVEGMGSGFAILAMVERRFASFHVFPVWR